MAVQGITSCKAKKPSKFFLYWSWLVIYILQVCVRQCKGGRTSDHNISTNIGILFWV